MLFLDLFSGIGGFRRGLERSGHTCVGHVEIDKYANISYMAMYDLLPCKFGTDQESNTCRVCRTEVNHECDGTICTGEWYAKDIKQIRGGELPKAEIWTFGFPCQNISLAGKREGLRGDRSGLFFTVVGLLKSTPAENKPREIIVENVKHLVSSEGGGAFTTVLTELWESGYDTEWAIVNSKDFYTPQNRERVYIVGHLRGECTGKVFPIGGANGETLKEIIGGHQGERVYDSNGLSVTLTAQGGGAGGKTGLYLCETKDPEQLMECLKELPDRNGNAPCEGSIDEGGRPEEKDETCRPAEYAGFFSYKKEPDMTERAKCLVAHYNAGITKFGESSGVMHCFACDQKCIKARAVLTPDRLNKRQNGRRVKEEGEPSFTITATDKHGIMIEECPFRTGLPIRSASKQGYILARHGDGINLSYPNSNTRRGRVGNQCSQTILTGGAMGVMIYCRIRRLTPRETWRLQAFEDYLFDRARAAGVSDAQLYKQAGNAVTVNVVYEIGKRLSDLERID